MTVTLTLTAADGAISTVTLPAPTVTTGTFAMVNQPAPQSPGRIKTITSVSGVKTDFTAESASQSYSIASAGPGVAGSAGSGPFTSAMIPVSLDRFEVRKSDLDPYTGGQRAEWDGGDRFRDPSGNIRLYPKGSTLWGSMAVCLLKSPIDNLLGICQGWQIIGQLHQSPGSGSVDGNPIFCLEYETDYQGGMRVIPDFKYATANPMTSNGQETDVDQFTTFAQRSAANCEPYAIGVWHYWVFNLKTDPTGTNGGFLKVWHKVGAGSPLQIINYTGPIGYASDTGSYWKYGIYGGGGGAMAVGTAAIAWVANVEFGTTDLTARITTPLAVPPTTLLF